MPRPIPIDPETRAAIIADLTRGAGRNETARLYYVSPGTVSSIAATIGHTFLHTARTAAATRAHQIDAALRRTHQEHDLLAQEAAALASGRTRQILRIERRLYELHRKATAPLPGAADPVRPTRAD